ncbi:hypothetical protein PIB30_012662 [Stylosanthes scabra]|nr:hypothetical protein [Stylosanthes scabra]
MEDSTALTIEFLRARLLSERSISRRARQRADELEKKVIELEEQVRMVTLQRKMAEKATADILAILENHGISDISNEFESESGRDTPCEYGVSNDSTNDGERFLSSKGRQNGSEELSSSDLDSSPLYGGLSWKGHHDSSPSLEKYNNHNVRRETSSSSVSSSSKNHHCGKPFRKIRNKRTRSAVMPGYISVEVDCQENEVAPYFEGFQNCSDGYERDKDMEKALEHQGLPIDEYEAMEKAQIDLEEKFRENHCAIPGSYDWSNKKDETKTQHNSNAQDDEAEATDTCFFERSLRVPTSFDQTRGYNNQKNTTFSSDDFFDQENLHSQLKGKQIESPNNYHSHSSNQHNEEPYSHYYPDSKLIDKAESSCVLFFEELLGAGGKYIAQKSFDGKRSYDNQENETSSSDLSGQENSTSQLKGSQNESSANCHYQPSNLHLQEPYGHHSPDSKQIDNAEPADSSLFKGILTAEAKDKMKTSVDGTKGYNNQSNPTFSSSDVVVHENSHTQLKENQNESSENYQYDSSNKHNQEPYGCHYPYCKQIGYFPTDVHGGLHQNDDLYALVCHEQSHKFSGVLESLKQAKTIIQQELNNRAPLVETEYVAKACKPSAYVSKSEKNIDIHTGSFSFFRQPTDFPDEEATASSRIQDSTSRLRSNFFLDRGISRTTGYSSKTSSLFQVDQSLANPQLLNGSRFNSRKVPFDAFCDGGLLSSNKQVYPGFPIFPIYSDATAMMSMPSGDALSGPDTRSRVGVGVPGAYNFSL